jgi:hypothetical protein
MKNFSKEQNLLARLRTTDVYDWQEFNRYYQNEEYGDSILEIYRYLSKCSQLTFEELEKHINNLPDFCLKNYQQTDSSRVLTASEQVVVDIFRTMQE